MSDRRPPALEPVSVTLEGGRRLQAYEAGLSAPLVVFEAGLNDWSRTWPEIQAEVAKVTRTISYDRAGRGESHWAAPPRSAADAATDLRRLLFERAGDDPVVLVAHSFGGFIARVYASRWPVAGLVLIDAAQEDTTRLTAPAFAELELPPRRLDEPEWLTLARFEKALHTDPAFPRNLPSSEGMDYETSRQQVIAAGSLGTIPTIVISAGSKQQLRRVGAQGAVAAVDKEWERVWKECQRKLARLSVDSVFVEATESDHYVQQDQPQLVIETVLSLVDRIRRETPA